MGELDPVEMCNYLAVYPEMVNVTVGNLDIICTEAGAIPPEMSYVIIKEKLGWDLEES